MATDTERALSLIKEKVELLTGERSNGSRRAVLISELEALLKLFTDKTVSLSNKIEEDKKAITDEFWKNLEEENKKVNIQIDTAVEQARGDFRQAISEAKSAIKDIRQSTQAARTDAHKVFQDAQSSITRLREESASAFEELAQIAETLLEIRSDVDGNSAAITVEAGARAAADLAIAGQITTINANVNNNSASITSEAVARATAVSALSSRIDSLVVESGNSTAAAIDTEATARIAGDEALGTQITTVSARASAQRVFNQSTPPSSTNRIVGDLWYDSSAGLKPYYWSGSAWTDNSDNRFTTIAASVTTETTARINADGALSSQITALTSTVNGNIAAINTEAATRATTDTALSSSLSSLTSTVNSNKATLDAEITTRADADSALSSSITSLTSTVNNNKASLDQEIATRANADSAITSSITSLTSTVNTNKATLDQEIVTRANADTSLSSQITSLTSTVNNNKASLDSEISTRASADSALSGRVTTVEASTTNTTGTGVLARLITEELTRSAADGAVATAITAASVGLNRGRIFQQTTAPSSSGRTVGDVWYDTDDNYRPYYWTGSAWADNSTGTYKIGAVAAIQQSMTAMNDAVQWGIQGTIAGQPAGSIALTGWKSPTTGEVRSLLKINSNVEINGSLLVTGTVTTGAAADNAFTEGTSGYGNGSASCSIMAQKAGDRFVVIGSYAGGSSSAANSFGFGGTVSGRMVFNVNNQWDFASVDIRGFVYNVTIFYGAITNYFATAPTTYTASVTAGGAGLHVFRVTTGLNEPTTISVFRLSK